MCIFRKSESLPKNAALVKEVKLTSTKERQRLGKKNKTYLSLLSMRCMIILLVKFLGVWQGWQMLNYILTDALLIFYFVSYKSVDTT